MSTQFLLVTRWKPINYVWPYGLSTILEKTIVFIKTIYSILSIIEFNKEGVHTNRRDCYDVHCTKAGLVEEAERTGRAAAAA
jgi:hypothetical protein